MFSFGGQELLIIVVFALLLFGPDKIPQLARTIGKFTREFNKYKSIMESTINAELYKAEGPTKDTVSVEERITKAAAATDAYPAAGAVDAPDEETEDGRAVAVEKPKAKKARPVPKPVATLQADEADEEDGE